MTKSAILLAGFVWFLAASVSAQPDDQGQNIVRAEAPIVAGNAVSAKKRALDDAFRKAVEQAYAEILKQEPLPSPAPPGVAQLRSLMSSAPQKFVRGYRLVEQQRDEEILRVMVDVDVDTPALRREIDRARGTGGRNILPAVQPIAKTMLVAGTAPAGALVAKSLVALRVPAQLAQVPSEQQLLAQAARLGAVALFVTASSKAENPVRGAFRVPVSCAFKWRLYGAGPQAARGPAASRTDNGYGFGIKEGEARNACFAEAAAEVARGVAAALRTPMTAVTHVTLKLQITNVGVVPIVLRALRRIGSSTAQEVRHITSTEVELRVFTRVGGPALFQSLTRELGGKLTLTPVQTAIDEVVAKVEGADVLPPEDGQ
jgi:hypothetical protein